MFISYGFDRPALCTEITVFSAVTLREYWRFGRTCGLHHLDTKVWRLSQQVDSKGFWRWCITIRITGYLDFFHRPVYWRTEKVQNPSNSDWVSRFLRNVHAYLHLAIFSSVEAECSSKSLVPINQNIRQWCSGNSVVSESLRSLSPYTYSQ
jgi:hypothetical protein